MINLDYIYENLEELIQQEEKLTYPLPINVLSADGATLVCDNGEKYLDLTSNLNTQPFGYSLINNESVEILNSGLFSTKSDVNLSKAFSLLTKLENTLFLSSKNKCYSFCGEIIQQSLIFSTKKKVIASVSESKKELLNQQLGESQIEFIPTNNESILKTVFSKDVSAIYIELVQVSEEIIIANESYLLHLKELCEKNDVLLVFDATNCPPYRYSSSLLPYNNEVFPDLLMLSDGYKNGLDIGICAISDKAKLHMATSESKNSQVSSLAICEKIIKNELDYDIQKNILNLGQSIIEKFEDFSKKHISVGNIIKTGMCISFDTEFSAYLLQKKLFEKKIIVDALSQNRILLTPAYLVREADIDLFIKNLEQIIQDLNIFDEINE